MVQFAGLKSQPSSVVPSKRTVIAANSALGARGGAGRDGVAAGATRGMGVVAGTVGFATGWAERLAASTDPKIIHGYAFIQGCAVSHPGAVQARSFTAFSVAPLLK